MTTDPDVKFELFKQQRIIEELQAEIPKVLKLLDEEIAKIDSQLKRWSGFWGFFRFIWDDVRGKAK